MSAWNSAGGRTSPWKAALAHRDFSSSLAMFGQQDLPPVLSGELNKSSSDFITAMSLAKLLSIIKWALSTWCFCITQLDAPLLLQN